MNRRSSGYSPMTPRSSHEFEHSSPAHNFDGGADNGLGNLADELGGSDWDEDEEAMDGDYIENGYLPREEDEDSPIGLAVDHDGSTGHSVHGAVNGVARDSGVAMQSSSPSVESKTTLSPQAAARHGGKRHQRARSLYDGSDYGDDSDLEANEGISAGLEKQLAAIESLVRRGLEDNGSASDHLVKGFIDQLRDLGSQASTENNATRHKTTCDALTSHLTHQSRTLTSVSASFSGPRAIIPDPDSIDTLLPLIQATLESLPRSSNQSLVAFTQVSATNHDLIQHLSNIADLLHMGRQVQTNAARRLKTAKDHLAEWRKESDLRDQGVQFIENGDWDRKLREREAKAACGLVIQGFEEAFGVCRQRLCEGLGVASA